ncbi:uncharacterized protein MELLADRAFT_112082 [Melampsora larici-populina 98AG31]|uniref:Uncharacterized protein n=1 Tax=Melampsora larici-populina (strain 98AG31 / pathotype 3-4-7) TaxID=747676 RepID=F4S5B5_MELLP|nr:uncharacterized protein MELLADRAFT_112082 [Melampsora larici-populina 98AG31]EGG00189.1 hypothetical protein MELLADRAFT_112082 [Melampsora larici-populina 98AG31]
MQMNPPTPTTPRHTKLKDNEAVSIVYWQNTPLPLSRTSSSRFVKLQENQVSIVKPLNPVVETEDCRNFLNQARHESTMIQNSSKALDRSLREQKRLRDRRPSNVKTEQANCTNPPLVTKVNPEIIAGLDALLLRVKEKDKATNLKAIQDNKRAQPLPKSSSILHRHVPTKDTISSTPTIQSKMKLISKPGLNSNRSPLEASSSRSSQSVPQKTNNQLSRKLKATSYNISSDATRSNMQHTNHTSLTNPKSVHSKTLSSTGVGDNHKKVLINSPHVRVSTKKTTTTSTTIATTTTTTTTTTTRRSAVLHHHESDLLLSGLGPDDLIWNSDE